ncbi:Golgin candidate 5, partial [Mucuna pruriens]
MFKDVEDLQKCYQASERWCEELITQVPKSTRLLLRQIENMQETNARRSKAWIAIERTLNSRLQEVEAKAATVEERERSVNERLSQTLSRVNVLEAHISCLRVEQTQLSRTLEKESTKIHIDNKSTQILAKNPIIVSFGRFEIDKLTSNFKKYMSSVLTCLLILRSEKSDSSPKYRKLLETNLDMHVIIVQLVKASGVCKTKTLQRYRARKVKGIPKVDDEDEDEDDESFCGSCGGNYSVDEFWICCDTCNRWFHGKCVKITPQMAESIDKYKCPSCSMDTQPTRFEHITRLSYKG